MLCPKLLSCENGFEFVLDLKKWFKIWKSILNFKFQSESEFWFFKSQNLFEMKKYSQYIWTGGCMYCFVGYDMNKHMHATGVSINNEFCNFK